MQISTKLRSKIASGLNFTLDLLLPRRCVGCKKEGVLICAPCRINAVPPDDILLQNATAAFSYKDPTIREAIHLLKYNGRKRLARPLAESLYDKLMEELAEWGAFENSPGQVRKKIFLVPIPISKKRFQERGFNQAELIAKEILDLDGGKTFELLPDILRKLVDSKPQARLREKASRLENLKGTFGITEPRTVRGKTILLIDDVITTGATMREAEKVLYGAGARTTYFAAIAH